MDAQQFECRGDTHAEAYATRQRIPGSLAAGGKERLEEGGRFVGEDAGEDFDAVVEARMGEDLEAGTDGAAFGIVCAVNEASNASLNHGTSAHGARLDRDIESRAGEAIVGKDVSGCPKDDNFGVSGGVVVANRAIAGTGDDFLFVDEDCADGDFTGFGGGAGFVERELHVVEIGRHLEKKE